MFTKKVKIPLTTPGQGLLHSALSTPSTGQHNAYDDLLSKHVRDKERKKHHLRIIKTCTQDSVEHNAAGNPSNAGQPMLEERALAKVRPCKRMTDDLCVASSAQSRNIYDEQ